MFLDYLNEVQALIDKVRIEGAEELKQASVKIAEIIRDGGIIHLFGCGHSHIISEEVFYRAGGLACIHPILIEPLMLHEGAVRSSQLEKKEGFAQTFIEEQEIQSGDVVIVTSTSGRNPVPIDVAITSKAKGAYVIGLTGINYSKSQPSRHPSGKRLFEVVDLFIDNYAEKGDTVMMHPKMSVPFGSTSTIIGTAIINAILVEVINQLIILGVDPPVFLSGNVEGAEAHNLHLVEKYGKRIPLLQQEELQEEEIKRC